MATRETPGDDSALLRAVADARAELDQATKAMEDARARLVDRMAEAAAGGEWISRIAKRAVYEPAYVRRLVRERGVEPRQPGRPAPPGFRRAPAESDEVDA